MKMKIIYFLFLIISFFHINCKLPFFNLRPSNKRLSSEKNITYVYGHLNPDTDAISSAIILADYLNKTNYKNLVKPCRLGELNKETKFALETFNTPIPDLITDPSEADEVILVDHNNPSQSLKFSEANIVALIDHHAITGFYTSNPINILTKPLGCTCTILYELYKSNNIEISNSTAGLMVSAIISDIDTVKNLSKNFGIYYETYGKELLARGADVSDLTEEQIINLDSKAYEVNGYNIQIAFLNSVDVEGLLNKRKAKLLTEINKFIENNKKQLFSLVIVDIYEMNSTVLADGEYIDAVEKAFNVTLNENEAFLKGITSRKKEVYPKLAEVFNSLPEYDKDNSNDKDISSYVKINWILILFLVYLFK